MNLRPFQMKEPGPKVYEPSREGVARQVAMKRERTVRWPLMMMRSFGMLMLGPLSRQPGGTASCGLSTARRVAPVLSALSVTVTDSPTSMRSASTLRLTVGSAEGGAWA
ncbi:MAG TPA: hypothetical protein VFS43_16450 [Polyangiaceae bacterium]|nr:hypothetical protein [Polyangiaceae bacterium]